MRKALLFLLLSCACANAQQYVPRSSSGGVDGQDITPNSVTTGAAEVTSFHCLLNEVWINFSDGNNYLGKITYFRPFGGGPTTASINGTTGLGDFVSLTLGGVAVPSVSSASTLTNKRVTQRVATLTDAATVTPNSDDFDGGILTELSQDSTIANPTGTPTDQQRYLLRIKSTTSRALTWGSEYRGSTGIPLATDTTGGGKTDYFVLIRDVADSKWDVMPNRGF